MNRGYWQGQAPGWAPQCGLGLGQEHLGYMRPVPEVSAAQPLPQPVPTPLLEARHVPSGTPVGIKLETGGSACALSWALSFWIWK